MNYVEEEAEKIFSHLDGKRSSRVARWKEYAGWCAPWMVDDTYSTSRSTYEDTEIAGGDSLGIRCVNHLANKIVNTLFLPYRPFFRVKLDTSTEAQLRAVYQDNLELYLNTVAKKASEMINVPEHRTKAVTVLKYLIITGNCLVAYPEDTKSTVVISPWSYVTKRDFAGQLRCLVIAERKSYTELTPEQQKLVGVFRKKEHHTRYIKCVYDSTIKKFKVTEHIDNKTVPNSEGIYPREKLPYLPLVWHLKPTEDMGRGLVEDYARDFVQHQQLVDSFDSLSASVSRCITVVSPSAMIDAEELASAEAGAYISGNAAGMAIAPQPEVTAMAQIAQAKEMYERAIGAAFLLNSAMTRNAERVTTVEVQAQQQELETTYGNMYSTLANDWQTPLAYILLDKIGDVNMQLGVTIVTGMDVMSTYGDAQALRQMIADLSMIQNIPQAVAGMVNISKFIAHIGALNGVDIASFMKTPAELEAEETAQRNMLMAQQEQQRQANMQQALMQNMQTEEGV